MAEREDEQEAGIVGVQDLYAVLGLKKECSAADLKSAYKKLALRWHPDRCSAAEEEATNKFQAIQKAYSVLSDSSKRSLYDVGWLHEEDDAAEMGDFLGEMLSMMNQTSPTESGGESLADLQQLFFDTFQADASDLKSSAGDLFFCVGSSDRSFYSLPEKKASPRFDFSCHRARGK